MNRQVIFSFCRSRTAASVGFFTIMRLLSSVFMVGSSFTTQPTFVHYKRNHFMKANGHGSAAGLSFASDRSLCRPRGGHAGLRSWSNHQMKIRHPCITTTTTTTTVCHLSGILDVDFERVNITDSSLRNAEPRQEQNNVGCTPTPTEPQTLLDLASDPELDQIAVPFLAEGDNYIPVRLAFTANLDGVTYAIGVPFEHAAAITVENFEDGSVSSLSPDAEENMELMEIMATQLQEHVSPKLFLKRTPRVLTISGPLDQFTEQWQTDLIPKPADAKTLLQEGVGNADDDDDALESFYEFMRKELGEVEFQNTMQSDDPIDDELLALFDLPGSQVDSNQNPADSAQEFINSLLKPEEDMKEWQKHSGSAWSRDESGMMALKLISYMLAPGRSYSLVKLLQPPTLVARQVVTNNHNVGVDGATALTTHDKPDIRFELISKQDEEILIPRLEQVCWHDLERIGRTSLQ